uniref:Uncharacterized protein n=1 Tax=Nelumbo nucifera TaxID=4432 RepID=A0A822XV36_NELNU|nr:TPA_asm: hypothetical protein HUJ06_024128 [Nelumbo nucifera]
MLFMVSSIRSSSTKAVFWNPLLSNSFTVCGGLEERHSGIRINLQV